MSSPFTCVPCNSSTPVSTNIPGPMGDTGPYPITTTTADFTIPSVGLTVTISVVSTIPFVVGQNIFVGSANFLISAINSPTSLTITALQFTGDATGLVPSGSTLIGGVGNLQAESILTIVTVSFQIPTTVVGVNVAVSNTSQLSAGMNLYVGGANFLIDTINGANSLTLEYLNFIGDAAPGATIPVGTPVTTGVGNLYAQPKNSSIYRFPFTIPAIGSTGQVSVNDPAPFQIGQNITIYNTTQSANFLIVSINANQLTVRTLGWPGDTVPAQIFPTLSIVALGATTQNFQRVTIDDATGTFNNFSNNSSSSNAHGLFSSAGAAVAPSLATAFMRCVTTDANSGYTAGDLVSLDRITGSTQTFRPIGFKVNSTVIVFLNNGLGATTPYKIVKADATASVSFNDGTGGSANMANFQLRAFLQV